MKTKKTILIIFLLILLSTITFALVWIDIIKLITPESIACYGAEYPKPHFEQIPNYNQTCLKNLVKGQDDESCFINWTNIFVNSTFKVGDENLLYKQQLYYCAHKRIITNPTNISFLINPSFINTTLVQGKNANFEILIANNGVWQNLFTSGTTTIPKNNNITLLFFSTKQNPTDNLKYDINAFGVTEDPYFTAFDNNNSLLMYLPFDANFSNTNPVTLKDFSGNGNNETFNYANNLTLANFTGLSVNFTNGSLKWNDVSAGSQTPNVTITAFNSRGNFTYCWWQNVTNVQHIVDNQYNPFRIQCSGSTLNLVACYQGETGNTAFISCDIRKSSCVGGGGNVRYSFVGNWTPNVWQHFCYSQNITISSPDNITEKHIYINGTLMNTSTHLNTTPAGNVISQDLTWGQIQPDVTAYLDEVRFYGSALTNEQIANLSNTTFLNPSTAVANLAPNINLILPANASQFLFSNRPFNFSWNATDDTNTSLNCNLLINSTTNASLTGVIAGANTSVVVNLSLGYGYTWGVNCTDGSLTNQTLFRVFNVTHLPPRIDLINPQNASSFAYTSRPFNFSWNVTSDINTTLNCNLLINSTTNASLTGVIAGANTSTIVNLSRGFGYTWGVNCTDVDMNNQTTFRIFNITNTAPTFTQQMQNFSLKLGQNFLRQINATDADSDSLTYSNNQTHLFNTSVTGLINTTPTDSVFTGNFTTIITINDGFGGTVTSQFNYEIGQSLAPTINFSSPTNAQSITNGTNVSFSFVCNDDVNSTLNAVLLINSTVNQSFTQFNNGSTQTLSRLFSVGSYKSNINCTDGYNSFITGDINFSVDVPIPPPADIGTGGGGGGGIFFETFSTKKNETNKKEFATFPAFITKPCFITQLSDEKQAYCSYTTKPNFNVTLCDVINEKQTTTCRINADNTISIFANMTTGDNQFITRINKHLILWNKLEKISVEIDSKVYNLGIYAPITFNFIPNFMKTNILFKIDNTNSLGLSGNDLGMSGNVLGIRIIPLIILLISTGLLIQLIKKWRE